MRETLLSVCLITYNQVKYIKQAIEGVLMQQVDFTWELIIADDYSTDGTREIVLQYKEKYPEFIKLILQEKNVGGGQNWIDLLTYPKSKYIAYLEGDDYWIDPNKLKKQADYLENNDDYGMVYTQVKIYSETENQFKKKCFGASIRTIDDLLLKNYISSPTVVFRMKLFVDYLEIIKPNQRDWLMGDYPLWLWFASVSKIKCLEYPSTVYRILENSATHSTDFRKEKLFVESYHSIKLFYVNRLGNNYLNRYINEKILISKAHMYLFKNEVNIFELVKEIRDSKDITFKLSILKIFLKTGLSRKLLKFYWRYNI